MDPILPDLLLVKVLVLALLLFAGGLVHWTVVLIAEDPDA